MQMHCHIFKFFLHYIPKFDSCQAQQLQESQIQNSNVQQLRHVRLRLPPDPRRLHTHRLQLALLESPLLRVQNAHDSEPERTGGLAHSPPQFVLREILHAHGLFLLGAHHGDHRQYTHHSHIGDVSLL